MSDPEPNRERGSGHAGAGGGSGNGGGGGRSATDSSKDKGNTQSAAAAATNKNATEPPAMPPVPPGLAELREILNAMATAPPGVPPQLDKALIERIKNSPLSPVLEELGPLYRKLNPPEGSQEAQAQEAQRAEANRPPPQPASTPGPGPSSAQVETASAPGRASSSAQQPPATTTALDVAELKGIQAGLGSISATLSSVAQAVTREAVKASATIAKTQIEAVDKKVTQMSGKLDPLAEVKVGVQRLQAGLLDEAKAERTRLEARNKELEDQVKELQQVIQDTRAELLPVEVASKIALQGVFSDEPDKTDGRGGNQATTGALVQTAKKDEVDSNVPDFGTEGEWGRCVEYVQASNSKLRTAVEEKKETVQKLLFVGFVVEQIRKGHYSEKEWESDDDWKNFAGLLEKSPDGFAGIRHLAEDLSRLTAQASTPPAPNGPTSSTAFEGSHTSTAKPAGATTQAPVEPGSTPAFTAPGSPVVPTSPITAKKDRDVRVAELEAISRANGNSRAGNTRNAPVPPVLPGLAELVEILNAMAAAPLGARPKLNQASIERIRNSQLHPVIDGLQSVYRKLGPLEGSSEHLQAQGAQQPNGNLPTPLTASTPGPGPSSAQQPTPAAAPAAAGITNAEAGLKSVSSKLKSVSEAITTSGEKKDMKASTKAAKERAEAADRKLMLVATQSKTIQVSQVSGKLEPALTDLAQEVKKLQVDMIDEFNGERTRFDTKVKGLEMNVNELQEEVKELKKETKELQQVIRDAKAELLAVEVASEIALQGTFSDEHDKTSGPLRPNKAPSDLLQTAKRSKLGANAPDISMEGEWGRCAEHLRTSNAKLRNAVVEKEETIQKLHLVGLVLDQMRRGNSVQLVSQDISRPTGQPTAATDDVASSAAPEKSKPSTAETVIAVSPACTSFSDLNPSFYLS
ncbi:hypothetical protein FRC00_000494 [Tulasnella sp. 408]|nr:hypothetical protein FRC00_000494 [Tulasnella sp. 408]